ncbi:MAG: ethylbenzene dehydrogenase-related protein [Myxococcales bacterium]|nr:ethylbenzene dehydrogenase-related protein [Myxococcales bacterium]
MKVRYVPSFEVDAVLQPDGALWQGVTAETVKLKGTSLDMQPTPAIKISWANKKIGAVEAVQVAAIHDGQRIAFRLEWSDPIENRDVSDTTDFIDGCGVLFPAVQFAPMAVMGAVGMGVNAWYWRADENGRGRHLVAEGLGTTRAVDEELVRGNGVYVNGRWHVVITRSMKVQTTESLAQLEPGQTTGVGVAVWEGGHGERAGIKAISGDDWVKLEIEKPTTGTA